MKIKQEVPRKKKRKGRKQKKKKKQTTGKDENIAVAKYTEF